MHVYVYLLKKYTQAGLNIYSIVNTYSPYILRASEREREIERGISSLRGWINIFLQRARSVTEWRRQ